MVKNLDLRLRVQACNSVFHKFKLFISGAPHMWCRFCHIPLQLTCLKVEYMNSTMCWKSFSDLGLDCLFELKYLRKRRVDNVTFHSSWRVSEEVETVFNLFFFVLFFLNCTEPCLGVGILQDRSIWALSMLLLLLLNIYQWYSRSLRQGATSWKTHLCERYVLMLLLS